MTRRQARHAAVLFCWASLAGSAEAADDRSRLIACQALLARATHEPTAAIDPAELERCRIVVREWTLRDSRMTVDEQGRPVR